MNLHRCVASVCGALLLGARLLHAVCEAPQGGYTGSIDDKYPIVLVMDSGYAYNTSEHVIPIKSEITTEGEVSHVTIQELDENGKSTAVFEGTFQDTDPRHHYAQGEKLRCEVITGTWKSLKDGRTLPFYLQESGSPMGGYEDAPGGDASIDRAAVAFRRAVVKGDRKAVAASIQYPITLFLDGNRRNQKKVRTGEQFLAVYDRVFLPRYVKKITEAIPLLMFHNSYGIMLGDGEVWFDYNGKVTALNSLDLDAPSLLERLASSN